MSFFKKLASIFAPGRAGGGLSQRTIDNYRATLLLSSYAKSKSTNHAVQPSQEQVDEIFKTVQAMSFEDLATFAQNEIHQQMVDLFARLDTYSKDNTPDTMRTTTSLPQNSQLSLSIGYELERRTSTIPQAGQGVFVSIPPTAPIQTIPAGSVIALFPGQVHLSEFTTQKGYVQRHLLPDPDLMCMVRVDEPIVVDGRTANVCPPNPFALAHLVNHCGLAKPNVLQHPYNYPVDPLDLDPNGSFPRPLRKYIPNLYARKPTLLGTTDRSALMHGLVLLAARPLQDGDELLMDYRLSSSGEGRGVPSWYDHYDKEQAETRWKS